MTHPSIRVFPDAEAVSQAAAQELIRCAAEAIKARGRFSVALSGGSTPQRLFQLLSDPPFRPQVDWLSLEIFWGDERCVPPNHKDSNYRMASEALLNRVPIPAAQIHRMEAEPSAMPRRRAITRRPWHGFLVGPSRRAAHPRSDSSGHGTGRPYCLAFPDTTRTEETRRWVVPNHVPQLNTDRLTLTRPILNRGRRSAVSRGRRGQDGAIGRGAGRSR